MHIALVSLIVGFLVGHVDAEENVHFRVAVNLVMKARLSSKACENYFSSHMKINYNSNLH